MASLFEKFDKQKRAAQAAAIAPEVAPAVAPTNPNVAAAIAPATPATTPARRRRQHSRKSSNIEAVVFGGLTIAAIIGAGVVGYEYGTRSSAVPTGTEQPTGKLATPTPSEAASGTPEPSMTIGIPSSEQNLGEGIAYPITVPSVISGDMVREVRDGGQYPHFTEGQWFHPVYDLTQETAAENYRGIGPWYPVAFENLDSNAAELTTHGNVGELVISGRNGGRVMIAVMQLDAHQHDGAWGTDPKTGRFIQNPNWEMQYNFHSLQPLQEIWVVDPDTGKNLTWPDGSPVIYRANEQGIAAFAIPTTNGNDVRVGFVFDMPAQGNGVQAPEVKFEHGPNDNPDKTGENPLPDSVLKPMVAEQ